MADLFDTAALWAENNHPEASQESIDEFADEYRRYVEWAKEKDPRDPAPTPAQYFVASEFEFRA